MHIVSYCNTLPPEVRKNAIISSAQQIFSASSAPKKVLYTHIQVQVSKQFPENLNKVFVAKCFVLVLYHHFRQFDFPWYHVMIFLNDYIFQWLLFLARYNFRLQQRYVLNHQLTCMEAKIQCIMILVLRLQKQFYEPLQQNWLNLGYM